MSEANTKGKRLEDVDILRGVGIIIMVMAHIWFGGKFDRVIHSFHTPLWFLLSGFLYKFKDIPLRRQIVWKAKKLLIPYVFYGLINFVFWLWLVKSPTDIWWYPLKRLATYNTKDLPIAGALWFLTSMFFAEAIYILLDYVLKKGIIRSIVVLFIAVVFAFIVNSTGFRLPLALDTSFVCMGFMEIGRLYKQYIENKSEKARTNKELFLWGLCLIIINGGLSFVNGYINVKSGWYGFVPLFWINALIGVYALLMFSKWYLNVTREDNKVRNIVLYIGRKAIPFLLLNQLIILVFSNVYEKVNLPENIYVRAFIMLPFCVTALYLIAFLFDKIRNKTLRMLLGI